MWISSANMNRCILCRKAFRCKKHRQLSRSGYCFKWHIHSKANNDKPPEHLDHIILDQHDLHFGFEQVMTLLWVSHTMGQMQGQEKCISVYICSRPKDRLFLYDWGAHLRRLSPGDEELVLLSMLSMVTNCSDGHIPNGAGFEVTSIWKRRGRTMDLDLLKA